MAGGQCWGGAAPLKIQGGGEVNVSPPPASFFILFLNFFGGRSPQGGKGTLPRSPPALKGRFVRGGAVGEGPAALPPRPCPGGMKDLTPTDNKGGRGALPPHGPAWSGGTHGRSPPTARPLRAGARGQPGNSSGSAGGGTSGGGLETAGCLPAAE